jgi:hypothetical protein
LVGDRVSGSEFQYTNVLFGQHGGEDFGDDLVEGFEGAFRVQRFVLPEEVGGHA